MPLNRRNSSVFHRGLYRGQLQTVTLLKRNNDQAEGVVTAYTIYGCRRGNISKSGEPIQTELPVDENTQWLLPCIELRRVGVNYINVLDRIIDAFNMWWQPESPQTILLSQFDNYYAVDCTRIDPPPGNVLLGVPGINISPP